jgi:hypothetical protein
MEYDMFNADRTVAEEYEECGEFDAKGHITSYEEVFTPRLWIRGGYDQDEFQAFTHQWSRYRGCYSGMDNRELRYQLLDSINGPLEDAMYDVFGSKIYTIPDTVLLEELKKVAVKEIIAKPVNYSIKFSEENPVKLPQVQRKYSSQQPSSQQV